MSTTKKPCISPAWLSKWMRLHRAAGGDVSDDVLMTATARAIHLLRTERASAHAAAAITAEEYPDGILQMVEPLIKRRRAKSRVRRPV